LFDLALPKRFRLVRTIGQGGMGVVYEVFDEERGARVALKTIRDLTPTSLARFKREFRALADVHHPNLVSLGELLSEGDRWFFTMELVEGEDLLAYVRPAAAAGRALRTPALPETPSNDSALANAPTQRSSRTDAAGLDEIRLRSALVQLASALEALHAGGIVHRDVKPSNVRVTSAGRVVLLDFGLAEHFGHDSATLARMAGTPAYMAPEQAVSAAVGPAADWYAVGVVLHEALTGSLPFTGVPLAMMMGKQQDGPAPSVLAPGVPADLDALCATLLRFDARARPSGSAVLRALGAAGAEGAAEASLAHGPIFVGRAAELGALRRAFDAMRAAARPVTVLVEGESGVGKTSLVRSFVDELAPGVRDLVVLSGRCYEREAVPYKGLDGVVDALTRFLMREGPRGAQFVPTRPEPLAQIFPVLRRVEAFAAAVRKTTTLDPLEIRSRAFGALREMLTRLGIARPLVVVIDDLQWADADSFALLGELLRPPEAPPLLLVATVRAGGPGGESTVRRDLPELLRPGALPGEVRFVPVARLGADDARDLAARLIDRVARGGPRVTADAVAREAEGHPLFIDALVRHAALLGEGGVYRLDDALWSRIASLEAAARAIMELLAVAASPVTQEVLAGAAGVSPEELARNLARLRVAHLITVTGARPADTAEPYHDRVRAAVLGRLDDAARAERHAALARSLERLGGGNDEALFLHGRGAGDVARAAEHAVGAADAAVSALAFERAATLYETALELRAPPDPERRALLEKLGDALANAGRGARAAAVYREAAIGAPAATALDLSRRSAYQLLCSGHIDDGIARTREVLAAIGMRLPTSRIFALALLLCLRALLRVRGTSFRERDLSEIRPTDLVRLDICWSTAYGLSLVDPFRAAVFQTRGLLLAMRTGEPVRIARAISGEAGLLATAGIPARGRVLALLERARAIAERAQHTETLARIATVRGLADYLAGRFRDALVHSEGALRWLRDDCVGVAYETATAQSFSLWALAQLGDLDELRARQAAYAREGLERGNVYASVVVRSGLSTLVWLADDDPQAAHRVTTEVMKQWSKNGFFLEHVYELYTRTNADLYAGDPARAYRRLVEAWPALQGSMLRRVQVVRIETQQARARAAIALAAESRADREALLRDAARGARAIEREGAEWARPHAALLRAGIEGARGRREAAVVELRAAIRGFEAADLALYAAAARRALGGLVGGAEGEGLVRGADAWMAGETIKVPARMAAAFAPGVGG
jgi:hypothetical protein